MASDRLTSFPAAITAGTNLRIDLSYSDFLASDGGTLTIYLRGPQQIPITDFTLSTDDDDFTVDVAGSITTDWTPGIYQYTVIHTDTSSVKEVAETGRFEILPDPANQTTIEARSFNEIMVARLEVLLKEIALNPYKQIMISNRQYSLQNIQELENLKKEYEMSLFSENQADILKRGGSVQDDLSFQFLD